MHPLDDQQEMPVSSPAPLTAGVGTLRHDDPFQISTTLLKVPFPLGVAVPTTMQNVIDVQETETSASE
jgi:hypothetical protein